MIKAKYEDEIKDFFYSLMDEGDQIDEMISDEVREKIVEESLKEIGTDMNTLSLQLDLGVQNGYPIEKQFSIIRSLIYR